MHPFLEESSTQGVVLENCLREYFESGVRRLGDYVRLYRNGNYKRIIFSEMGSSYYAPHAVTGFLTEAGIPSFVVNAAELSTTHLGLLEKDTLLVAVSQSGASQETVER